MTGAMIEEEGGVGADDKCEQENFAEEEAPTLDITDSTRLSFWDIAAIQTSFSTAGVLVMMPYIYGQLGYVLGLIVTAVWLILTYLIACFMCDVVISSDGRCKHLPDAGYELAGKWGRRFFQILLYTNLVFYMPVALETIAISLQVVFGFPFNGGNGCIGWWKLITFAILFVVVMLIKNWKESSRVAYITVAVVTLKAFVLIPYGLVKYQSDYMSSDMNLGPSQPFGNPQPNVWDIFGCAIGYTTGSMLVLVETMPHAEKPQDYKKALGFATTLVWMYYAVPGLCSALLWGWNVNYLINDEFGTNALSIVLNLLIAIPVSLDFLLVSFPLNDAIRRRFIDNDDEKDAPDTSGKSNWWHQFKVTFPTLAWSFLFCSLVPHFDVMVSLLTALTLVPLVTIAPSLVWLFGGNRKKHNTWMLLHLASIGIGFTVFAISFAYAIYGIISTNYAPQAFWCDSE